MADSKRLAEATIGPPERAFTLLDGVVGLERRRVHRDRDEADDGADEHDHDDRLE
jgi:hypothetical protein